MIVIHGELTAGSAQHGVAEIASRGRNCSRYCGRNL